MSITMLQHFDYPESIAYEGNAGLSNVAKFRKACAHFKDKTSKISLTNTTGVFNLSANGSAEAECFVKAEQASGSGYDSNLTELFETELNSAVYKIYNGHVFKHFSSAITWTDAKTACEELGGHLATITSAEKQTFLINAFKDKDTTSWIGWVGAKKVGTQWTWITNEDWDYQGNIGSWGNDNENYLVLSKQGTYYSCSTTARYYYVCEWDSIDSAIPSLLKDNGYKFYNGHTFKYYSDTKTWTDAKAFCEELGGHLATSTSAEKNTFLTTLTTDSAWIGGTDEAEEGVWQWVTGEEWNYTNWGSGQPDNANSAEHYLEINFGGDAVGTWNDNSASTTHCYICEWYYDIRERAGSGVSSGNILSLSDNSNVVSTSDAVTQGYKFYNGHTFKYFSDNVLWPEAKAFCEELGGHLATSTSTEKQAFIETLTNSNACWLGGQKVSNTWQWITGETWDYTNWDNGEPNDTASDGMVTQIYASGKWDDTDVYNSKKFICEWDYDIREPRALTLSIADGGALNLKSAIWALDETSTLTLEPDTWYHVLLRLSEGTASVYLDGAQALSGNVSGEDITPQSLTLGGYVGYMDEFVFRDGAGTGAPTVPTSAYETGAGLAPTSSNAPVTRAVWTCEDLPEGLTLSSSGVLSGHPTTAGTYDCNVSVATNWGTATKTIRIVVNNV